MQSNFYFWWLSLHSYNTVELVFIWIWKFSLDFDLKVIVISTYWYVHSGGVIFSNSRFDGISFPSMFFVNLWKFDKNAFSLYFYEIFILWLCVGDKFFMFSNGKFLLHVLEKFEVREKIKKCQSQVKVGPDCICYSLCIVMY